MCFLDLKTPYEHYHAYKKYLPSLCNIVPLRSAIYFLLRYGYEHRIHLQYSKVLLRW
jgi:hypothetical protein